MSHEERLSRDPLEFKFPFGRDLFQLLAVRSNSRNGLQMKSESSMKAVIILALADLVGLSGRERTNPKLLLIQLGESKQYFFFQVFTVETQDLSIPAIFRSEEHTSELQSRFGISYAVFC